MNDYLEEHQFHPRYSRSEFENYLRLERRQKVMAFVGALLILGGFIGLIALLSG